MTCNCQSDIKITKMRHIEPITFLLLVSAIALSSAAAYYSVSGLMAIFAAAPIAIAIMGSTLEVSKLVVASWLYRNWDVTPKLLRSYFVMALIVLLFLTSMGVYGLLAKAHVDQNLVSGDVVARLSLLDEQIKTEKENINEARKIISQLDLQVNETISRSGADSTSAGVDRSVALRRAQAKERKAAQETILSAQAKIDKLQQERSPIAAQVREVEAEVGPVKYIAQLVYGEAQDQSTLEAAVRLVILMIVFVFDPLAVLMFIAVNQDIKRKSVSQSIQEEPSVNNEKHFDFPEVSEDFDPREEIERIQEDIREVIEEEPQYDRPEFKSTQDIEDAVEEVVKSKRINWSPYGDQDLRSTPIKRDL